jgi:mannose-6-phosphate isomerase
VFELDNAPRDYDWGSYNLISDFRGLTPSGKPEAEVWFGDHPACPAFRADTGESLIEYETERFGKSGRLPFLVKLLAAASPLSIQAHPTVRQAVAGFNREDSAGVPLDSPNRNYRDRNHKPEILIALSDFSALCGFRPADQRQKILNFVSGSGVAAASELLTLSNRDLGEAVAWLLAGGEGVTELISSLAKTRPASGDSVIDDAISVAQRLGEKYPNDPGIAISLLLNFVKLKAGEAVFLPAGNLHAYLEGLGVEVMATSDNVLRGGLTSKHIDVPELLTVVDFSELKNPLVQTIQNDSGKSYPIPVSEFAVREIRLGEPSAPRLVGPAVVFVIEGAAKLCTDSGELELTQGKAGFIEWDESISDLTGNGRLIAVTIPD